MCKFEDRLENWEYRAWRRYYMLKFLKDSQICKLIDDQTGMPVVNSDEEFEAIRISDFRLGREVFNRNQHTPSLINARIWAEGDHRQNIQKSHISIATQAYMTDERVVAK